MQPIQTKFLFWSYSNSRCTLLYTMRCKSVSSIDVCVWHCDTVTSISQLVKFVFRNDKWFVEFNLLSRPTRNLSSPKSDRFAASTIYSPKFWVELYFNVSCMDKIKPYFAAVWQFCMWQNNSADDVSLNSRITFCLTEITVDSCMS